MTREYRQHVYKVPAGATEVILIRHGESMPARPGVSFPMVEGHGDPALHQEGHRQAEAVAARLGKERFDALYVTILQRTHQTMAPLAARLGMEPKVERDLREVCLGEWDGGLYRIKAAERDPVYLRAAEAQEWGHIHGAETNAQVHARVRAALDRLAAAHVDERIAVCVHGGIIGTVMAMATGSEPFAFLGAANGSIHRVVLHEGVNARYLDRLDLPRPFDLVAADLAFISLRLVLPALVPCLAPDGDALVLVKPQFELERGEVGRGVVRDPDKHARAIERVAHAAEELGLAPRGGAASAIAGAKGNREFFLWLGAGGHPPLAPAELARALLAGSYPPAAGEAGQSTDSKNTT